MHKTRFLIVIAMVLFTIASMVTTYLSLSLSVLPEPTVRIPIADGKVWDCAWLALTLSVAIGIMLFALKLAIIDEQKRLNLFGIMGLFVVAFISISFNMDVLYRFADRDFFIRYCNAQTRSVYANYLAEVETKLLAKRESLERQVARQEGELEAEVQGLREAPEGYGPRAKKEDYALTVLQREVQVELKTIEEALAAKKTADELLMAGTPTSLDDIENHQDQLRVACKDVGAKVGLPLPEPVRLNNPLFAVFAKLFDFRNVGMMEIFILALAILLDLGDIIGYSMVPDKPKKTARAQLSVVPVLGGPEVIPEPLLEGPRKPSFIEDDGIEFVDDLPADEPQLDQAASAGAQNAARRRARRPFKFRRQF